MFAPQHLHMLSILLDDPFQTKPRQGILAISVQPNDAESNPYLCPESPDQPR